MSSLALYQLSSQFRELERLADEELPDEAIRETLDGLQFEIERKSNAVAKFACNLVMLRDAVDEASKAMKERAARINRRVEALHAYILANMQACGITKIESPEFTLSVQKNPPAVIIDDEEAIPDAYMVLPPPAPPPVARPDKKLIADALKAHAKLAETAMTNGEIAPESPVPGAHLEVGHRLKVRV